VQCVWRVLARASLFDAARVPASQTAARETINIIYDAVQEKGLVFYGLFKATTVNDMEALLVSKGIDMVWRKTFEMIGGFKFPNADDAEALHSKALPVTDEKGKALARFTSPGG
jgi:hypothetical protein